MSANMATITQAIIAYAPLTPGNPNLKLKEVTLRELKDDEVLVKILATGICHTDIVVASASAERMNYPKILGHEGAGIVSSTGASVTSVKAGDSVLLSFTSCSICHPCITGHPAYCKTFNPLNIMGEGSIFSTSSSSSSSTSISGSFFGHSSFANLSIVKESSIVNVTSLVKDEEDLKGLAPMGCGFQTGAGTVTELTKAGEGDSVAVLGLGGVGLCAIMAAKIRGCHAIIGVDRIASRLELATELGATHVINTSDSSLDLIAELRKITKDVGANVAIDTTGNMEIIKQGFVFTASLGQFVILGIPPQDGVLEILLSSYILTGKQLKSSVEGDAVPSRYIPQMIKWRKEGKFPVEKLVTFYQAKDFQQAIDDMYSGKTVKPVLIW